MKRLVKKKKAFTLIGPKDHETYGSRWREKQGKSNDSDGDKLTKSAFTLIELIVVMAVIGILVLLAAPKFLGYTEKAQYTKLISTSKELERASERYFMDFEDWPRLTDDAYTAAEIHEFAKRVYDITGKEVTLDPAGNYYDIDYDKLSQYVTVPDDRMHYVLRNPVGKVYALDGLTEIAKERATQIKPTDITFTAANLSVTVDKTTKLELNFIPADTTLRTVTFESANSAVATVDNEGNITAVSAGTTQITVTSQDKTISKSIAITVAEPFVSQDFSYAGTGQTFVVPEAGRYMLEVWGASGGNEGTRLGGKGGYSKADFNFATGDALHLYAGGVGMRSAALSSFNGGGRGGQIKDTWTLKITDRMGGGGGSDIRLNATALSNRIIVAGGGGGGSSYHGGNGGGANQFGKAGGAEGISYKPPAGGGTLTRGGDFGGLSHRGGLVGELWKGGDGVLGNAYTPGGGGGGGGYFGGASGADFGGGGGGSGYANTTLAVPGTILGTTGNNTGNGKVKITFIGN